MLPDDDPANLAMRADRFKPHIATLRAVIIEMQAPVYPARAACPTPAAPLPPVIKVVLLFFITLKSRVE